ncbi:pentapeptide repeat-containing protein [Microbispora sp. NPDC004025]
MGDLGSEARGRPGRARRGRIRRRRARWRDALSGNVPGRIAGSGHPGRRGLSGRPLRGSGERLLTRPRVRVGVAPGVGVPGGVAPGVGVPGGVVPARAARERLPGGITGPARSLAGRAARRRTGVVRGIRGRAVAIGRAGVAGRVARCAAGRVRGRLRGAVLVLVGVHRGPGSARGQLSLRVRLARQPWRPHGDVAGLAGTDLVRERGPLRVGGLRTGRERRLRRVRRWIPLVGRLRRGPRLPRGRLPRGQRPCGRLPRDRGGPPFVERRHAGRRLTGLGGLGTDRVLLVRAVEHRCRGGAAVVRPGGSRGVLPRLPRGSVVRLPGAGLSSADLSSADLSSADLSSADLSLGARVVRRGGRAEGAGSRRFAGRRSRPRRGAGDVTRPGRYVTLWPLRPVARVGPGAHAGVCPGLSTWLCAGLAARGRPRLRGAGRGWLLLPGLRGRAGGWFPGRPRGARRGWLLLPRLRHGRFPARPHGAGRLPSLCVRTGRRLPGGVRSVRRGLPGRVRSVRRRLPGVRSPAVRGLRWWRRWSLRVRGAARALAGVPGRRPGLPGRRSGTRRLLPTRGVRVRRRMSVGGGGAGPRVRALLRPAHGAGAGRGLPGHHSLALGLPGRRSGTRRLFPTRGVRIGRGLPGGSGRGGWLPRGRAVPRLPLVALARLWLPRVDTLALRRLPGVRSPAVRGLRRHGAGMRLAGRGRADALVTRRARRGKGPGVPGYAGGGRRGTVRGNGPESVGALRVVGGRFRRPETAGEAVPGRVGNGGRRGPVRRAGGVRGPGRAVVRWGLPESGRRGLPEARGWRRRCRRALGVRLTVGPRRFVFVLGAGILATHSRKRNGVGAIGVPLWAFRSVPPQLAHPLPPQRTPGLSWGHRSASGCRGQGKQSSR